MTDNAVPVVICQVCDRSLFRRVTTEFAIYCHGPGDPDDHTPVPIDAPPHWRGRCDFCTTATAEFVVPARDFTAPNTPDASSLGNWAACPTCAMLIESNRWNNLLTRAITAHERLHGHKATEEQVRTVRALYRAVRAAINGAIRPIPTAPATPPPMTAEQARTMLHQRLYGLDSQPPPYREPGTAQGSARLDADCIRLAAMDPAAFVADPEAVATAFEIAEQLGWD